MIIDLELIVTLVGFLITFLIVILSILWYLWSKKVKLYNHIPTPKYNLPIFGHALRFPSKTKDFIGFQRRLYEEAKSKTIIFWLAFLPGVETIDVNNVEHLLKSSSFVDKSFVYQILKEWLGDGLLIGNKEKWKSRRRLLTPAFHFDILKSNFEIMKHHAYEFAESLKLNVGDKSIEISSVAKYFSLNVICESAMGVRCNIYNNSQICNEEAKYLESVDKLLHLINIRIFKPWFFSPFVYRYFSADAKEFYEHLDNTKHYVKGVIEKRIQSLERVDENNSNILLDILISAHKNGDLDIEGIINEVNTIMVAGYDTVSSAISWTIYLLGRSMKVQEKLYDEIKDLDYQNISFDDISQLKYLECVIKESLRIHPPVPLLSRLLKNRTTFPNNFGIPSDTQFGVNIYHLHRDESYWKDPLLFCPERFLEDKEERNSFSYIPFSAGPRNCIGQRFAMIELKIVIFHLLRSFRFISVQAEDEIEEQADIVHRSANGIWVHISERSSIQ